MELQKGKVIILDYGLNEQKRFYSFKDCNNFIYENLLNDCYSSHIEDI